MRGLKFGDGTSEAVFQGRTSLEVRGLKYIDYGVTVWNDGGRTSLEVRGLKYACGCSVLWKYVVAPHSRCVD